MVDVAAERITVRYRYYEVRNGDDGGPSGEVNTLGGRGRSNKSD